MTATILKIIIVTIILQHTSSYVETRSARIVGGERVQIEQVPYIVNIRTNGIFNCGGSLITPKCVLTAAHCVKKRNANDFIVRAGVTYLDEHHNRRSVKNIYRPKLFNNKSLDYDLAVFELDSPLSGRNIQTIELSNETPDRGDLIKISGWGLTKENGRVSQQVRSVYVPVLSQNDCRTLYNDYRYVTDNMFCASVPGLKDSCLADSGGPAVLDNRLVGIVSWGRHNECARHNSPGVYVDIKAVKPWIENIMLKNCY